MAAKAPDVGEFSLVITANDPARLAEAAKDFAEAFGIDPDVSAQVVKSVPIVFAQKLTKAEVKAVTPKLEKLSEKGLEFRITARLAGKVPKLNWPARPQFTAAGSGTATGLSWDWQNAAFVCPGCGEAFVFQRVGKLPLADPAPSTETASAPAVRPLPPAVLNKPPSPLAGRRPPPPLIPEPEPEPVAPAGEPPLDVSREAEEIAPIDPMDEAADNAPLPGEGEGLDLPGAVEEIQLKEIESPGSDQADEVELLPEDEAPAEDEELYNVFLSKIVDKAKQARAVELICEIKQISEDEARELTNRLVIPIAKGIPKSEAEGVLERFKKAKIFGRMTPAK